MFFHPFTALRLTDIPTLMKFKGRGGWSAFGTYRKFIEPWWQSLNIKTVLDIGANAGQFGHACRLAFPTIRLHSFEPLKGPFTKLSSLAEDDRNWTVHNFALSNVAGETQIHADEYSPSSSLLQMSERHREHFPQTGQTTQQIIETKRLEDIFGDLAIEGRTLMKLDVQGYELAVLDGAEKILPEIDYILTEMSFVSLYEEQPLFADVYSRLCHSNFSFKGFFDQCVSPKTGELLQGDGIFVRNR